MDHFPQAGPIAPGVPKRRIPLAVLLAAGTVFTLTGSSLIHAVTGQAPESVRTNPETAADEARDLYGDALPAGAVLRLGTVRLRHPNNVLSVAFAPNGQSLATACWMDPQIRLWDVRTGRLIRTFRVAGRDTPRMAVISPNGAKLAAVCNNGTVHLWDVASGLEMRETADAHREGVESVAFAPDGRSFATSGFDGAVRLWGADASGHQQLVTELGSQTGSHPLAFSSDGKVLACGAATDIHLYDLESRTKTATIRDAHGESIVTLAFGPDGKTLFSAGESTYRIVREARGNQEALAESRPQLRLWDVAKGKMIREFVDAGFEIGRCAAVLSHDGRILASMQPNTILLWDVSAGKVTQRISGYWVPTAASDKALHIQYAISSAGLAISPDATTLACAQPDAQCDALGRGNCSPQDRLSRRPL